MYLFNLKVIEKCIYLTWRWLKYGTILRPSNRTCSGYRAKNTLCIILIANSTSHSCDHLRGILFFISLSHVHPQASAVVYMSDTSNILSSRITLKASIGSSGNQSSSSSIYRVRQKNASKSITGTEKFSSTNKCNKHNIAKHFKQKGKCIPHLGVITAYMFQKYISSLAILNLKLLRIYTCILSIFQITNLSNNC